jgi:hypothetical protein
MISFGLTWLLPETKGISLEAMVSSLRDIFVVEADSTIRMFYLVRLPRSNVMPRLPLELGRLALRRKV